MMADLNKIDPKLVESIPQDILRNLPASQPPPGIVPNFANPPTLKPRILGVGYTFLAIALVTYSLRIYTRLAINKRWHWDDLTITLGFIAAILYAGFVTLGCVDGAAGKHLWDVHLDRVINRSFLLHGVGTVMLGAPALGLIKSTFFIQYYVLFKPLRWARIAVWVGAIPSVTFYVVITITSFALNAPRPGQTLIETALSPPFRKFQSFGIPFAVIGVLVDWYLLILPIPAILNLAMSTTKKLGVLLVFMTGASAAVASIGSCYYRIQFQVHPQDATWVIGWVHLWSLAEMFAGVAAASMPTVKQFFVYQKPHVKSLGSYLVTSLTSRNSRSRYTDESTSSRPKKKDVWTTTTSSASDAYGYELPTTPAAAPTSMNNNDKTPHSDYSPIRVANDVYVVREDTSPLTSTVSDQSPPSRPNNWLGVHGLNTRNPGRLSVPSWSEFRDLDLHSNAV